MAPLEFGIVGTGMIAGVVAEAISKSTNAKLIAVSSRRLENAQSFTAKYPAVAAVQGIESLLKRAPTSTPFTSLHPRSPKRKSRSRRSPRASMCWSISRSLTTPRSCA